MEHSEYIREIAGSSAAILFIHGILGSPSHFNRFIDIVPKEWSVYNILLAGHGKSVDDFSAASMQQWKEQVARQMEVLTVKYEKIFIMAHSMGTLFALDASIKYPGKVKGLFLLAVPLKPFIRPSAINGLVKVIFDRTKQDDKIAEATKNEYSIMPDKRLWKYGKWVFNYWSLFLEIRKMRGRIQLLSVPCQAFQSKRDEQVAFSSVQYLKRSERIEVTVLEESGHSYYSEADYTLLLEKFRRFCVYECV